MSLRKFALFSFLPLLVTNIRAQHTNFNSQKNWSLHKKELQFGFGGTQFNGDLGGASSVGKDYSLKDIDWQSTGFAGWLGYRQRFHPYFATTTSLCIFNLKGNDAYSEEQIRKARNLNFRSFNIEIQQRIEFIFATVEKFSPTYNLSGSYPKKNRSEQYYVFTGIGLIYFNNQGYYNDPSVGAENHKWVNLRPIQTEGKSYLPVTLTIPAGIGFRFGISKMWRLGIELSYVKTFSDYIDDVSTVYQNPESFNNPVASYLSNPSDLPTNQGNELNWFDEGFQRGDSKQKDAYYHFNLIFTKNITYKDYGRQRKKKGGIQPRIPYNSKGS
ncbi:MAG: hypothetical protein FJX84_04385 [Bacteroidetes bacterium]|nr:hypothetical protein [Bacteroidota bacterium]